MSEVLRVTWTEGQMSRSKDLPSGGGEVLVADGLVVFRSPEDDVIDLVIPSNRLLSAVRTVTE